ncbi:MAG: T9SS type A sorting domain-containing protein [Ignavibacteriaceae bacterium]|nr:T9SS type A sorting domain-containing protein [Ignavibacteriaceae bacterium]
MRLIIPFSLKLVPLILLLSFTNLSALTTIKADNPNFQYTGRIDYTTPDKPIIYWPGTYIKTNFEGSILIIMLDDQTGQSFYNVFVDEDYENPKVIDCISGSQIYLVSATLKDTVHSLMIFRRTEASTGPTKFLGIQINDGKNLLPPPPRKGRKILFYGNSITCGMGNEAPDGGADDKMSQENNFLAYGAIASRLLDADYMCIAKSGIGLMISWFNFTMPDYYYRLNPDDPMSNWDFNEFIPDVVVINLLQNDSWLINNLNPVPDSAQRVSAYVEFVRTIRSRHPNALIVCSLGSMDATKIGSPWPGYIERAVQFLHSADSDTNLATLFFPFDPVWTKHPRVRHHQQMAQSLSNFVGEKMGWITDIENKYFAQQPSNFSLSQNYPNPFNPVTRIRYTIPQLQSTDDNHVLLKVFDILGNEITTLVNERQSPGTYEVEFYCNNSNSNLNDGNLSSGVYFYRLQVGDYIQTKKMVLMQ